MRELQMAVSSSSPEESKSWWTARPWNKSFSRMHVRRRTEKDIISGVNGMSLRVFTAESSWPRSAKRMTWFLYSSNSRVFRIGLVLMEEGSLEWGRVGGWGMDGRGIGVAMAISGGGGRDVSGRVVETRD
jgi:hypothetical protein